MPQILTPKPPVEASWKRLACNRCRGRQLITMLGGLSHPAYRRRPERGWPLQGRLAARTITASSKSVSKCVSWRDVFFANRPIADLEHTAPLVPPCLNAAVGNDCFWRSPNSHPENPLLTLCGPSNGSLRTDWTTAETAGLPCRDNSGLTPLQSLGLREERNHRYQPL